MLIVYLCGTETIITTPEKEAGVIKAYFADTARYLEDYDRAVVNDDAVVIRPRCYLSLST